jgi:hypothetical protein
MKKLSLILLLLFSKPDFAAFFSGKELFQWLDEDLRGVETYEGGLAKGYLMGIFDVQTSFNSARLCIPAGISALQLKMVVYAYLQNHPELRSAPANKLVAQAFEQTWFCP